jgi:bifunctional non-homologous end joining protein LigD
MRLPRALQLATLVDEPPEGDDWLHEQKFDGYRILAVIDHGEVKLSSRRFKDWTAEFPAVVRALATLPVQRAVLDGEVAVVLPDGRTTFQGLQNSFAEPSSALVYFAFDLLWLDDEDLSLLPLEQRKHRLAALLSSKANDTIRYSDHVVGQGEKFLRLACKRGLEGIVSKRRDKPYAPGRSLLWRKTKCVHRQEFVIGGFTDPEGSRSGIGALLVGYYDGGRLVYAGKVGTGFTHAMTIALRRQLEPLERGESPFQPALPKSRSGSTRHWVQPELVCEVTFQEWTDDGRLRHPSFQGMREDKPAREVVREAAAQPEPRASRVVSLPRKKS